MMQGIGAMMNITVQKEIFMKGSTSPMSIKSATDIQKKSIKVINPVAATSKIDLGYLDGKEYTDGISEHYLDK
jgi:hypothetical protein